MRRATALAKVEDLVCSKCSKLMGRCTCRYGHFPNLTTTVKETFASFMRLAPTKSEDRLSEHLKRYGFQKQAVIFGYIADFYHPDIELVVEVDGSAHRKKAAQDLQRDKNLFKHGVRVLHVNNAEVLSDVGSALKRIRAAVEILKSSKVEK
jgi:very-short-patch-repair endonuclease